MKPMNEQERIADKLRTNELFETDHFDRGFMTKGDLFRTAEKSRWVSPKDFQLFSQRGTSMPATSRHTGSREGFARNSNFLTLDTEPYADPSLDPGFVRSTKEYLRQAHQLSVQREIKLEESLAVSNLDERNTSGMSFLRTANLSPMVSKRPSIKPQQSP